MNDHTSAYFEGIKECRIKIHIAIADEIMYEVYSKSQYI